MLIFCPKFSCEHMVFHVVLKSLAYKLLFLKGFYVFKVKSSIESTDKNEIRDSFMLEAKWKFWDKQKQEKSRIYIRLLIDLIITWREGWKTIWNIRGVMEGKEFLNSSYNWKPGRIFFLFGTYNKRLQNV